MLSTADERNSVDVMDNLIADLLKCEYIEELQ